VTLIFISTVAGGAIGPLGVPKLLANTVLAVRSSMQSVVSFSNCFFIFLLVLVIRYTEEPTLLCKITVLRVIHVPAEKIRNNSESTK
jgi:hypothetical protein